MMTLNPRRLLLDYALSFWSLVRRAFFLSFFFFNDTATTEIYTLSLHDALPIWEGGRMGDNTEEVYGPDRAERLLADRKSTRLNSSHLVISYAVFCLKKKKEKCLGLILKTLVKVLIICKVFALGWPPAQIVPMRA